MDCLGGRSQTKWCYGVPGNLDIKTALDLLFVGSDRDWQSCSGYVFSSVFAVVGWWGRPKTWSRKMRSLMSPITTRSQVKTKPSMRSITLSPGIRWVYSIRLEHLRQYFLILSLSLGFRRRECVCPWMCCHKVLRVPSCLWYGKSKLYCPFKSLSY